ncbi:MAG: hypothetical protein HC838_00435 [Spirulinaceae cyanobacterium RM2_2_10]|nr:hypothetical protein [Spirulinaceae cyanobacterium SM2_1_0]NJO18829.1 hypothetical protein [Spirulinaceae cyanobacterium RM2_2_10]
MSDRQFPAASEAAASAARLQHLEALVEQMGQTLIATTETMESLATRVDTLTAQLQQQGQQVQQQGYQIFALSDAVQALVDNEGQSRAQIEQLTAALQSLIALFEGSEVNLR